MIAILAILSTVVVLVINPAEFLRKARDSRRLSDLQTINKAIGQYQADGGTNLGLPNKVYVSIPDSSTTCANLGLPTLPAGWEYRCSNSTDYRKVNGTGWVPVPFTSISFGTPLSTLPIDPINTTSTGNYYTYVVGGSWELTALFESSKSTKEHAAGDGGVYPTLYEVGTNILPILPTNLLNTAKQNDFFGSPWGNEANGVGPLLITQLQPTLQQAPMELPVPTE